MSSLDPATLQILDGAVRATVQERKKYSSVSHLIGRILERLPILSKEFLEKNERTVIDYWMTHTSALDDTEAPPSPPNSAKNVSHRGSNVSNVSNGLAAMEGTGSEERSIIPAEDPEVANLPLEHSLSEALTIFRRLSASLFRYTSRSRTSGKG
jgi:hypothetical protein